MRLEAKARLMAAADLGSMRDRMAAKFPALTGNWFVHGKTLMYTAMHNSHSAAADKAYAEQAKALQSIGQTLVKNGWTGDGYAANKLHVNLRQLDGKVTLKSPKGTLSIILEAGPTGRSGAYQTNITLKDLK